MTDRELQQVKVADTPDPKGMVRGTDIPGMPVRCSECTRSTAGT